MNKRESAFDERLWSDDRPKRKKKAPLFHYYETLPIHDGERCAACDFPIAGKQGLFFAKGMPGPFCRPECIASYHNLKGRMRHVRYADQG